MSDDGLHNGSAGVTFTHNHDVFKPFALEHVAQAYTLMMPGNTVVYFNGREFGDNRDFPKPGRGDALSVGRGSLLTRLLEARDVARPRQLRRTVGRHRRPVRVRARRLRPRAPVQPRRRRLRQPDADERRLPAGTVLVELTGNADDPTVNPVRGGNRDIPQVIRVFEEGGVRKVNVRFQRPGTIALNGQLNFHGRGLLVYGLATPQSEGGLEVVAKSETLPGQLDPANDRENGLRRQTDITVVRNDKFEVRLRTAPVRLLGSNDLRDVEADGDQALLRVDAGRDVNGNGQVDFRTPGTTEYGFERFVTKSRPLIGNNSVNAPRGDGEFRQAIDAARLEEGLHFLTARAYRHRTDGGPAVFHDFKKVVYIDRTPPVAAIAGARRLPGGKVQIDLVSRDSTADSMHVLTNVPAGLDDAGVATLVKDGRGQCARIDRALFRSELDGLAAGKATVTVVTFEMTGTRNVQRLVVQVP